MKNMYKIKANFNVIADTATEAREKIRFVLEKGLTEPISNYVFIKGVSLAEPILTEVTKTKNQ